MKSVSQVPLYLQALSLQVRFTVHAVLLYRAGTASAQFAKSLFAYRGLLIAFVLLDFLRLLYLRIAQIIPDDKVVCITNHKCFL